MSDRLSAFIRSLLQTHIPDSIELPLKILSIIILVLITDRISKFIIIRSVNTIASRTHTTWDDVLVRKKVFSTSAHIPPAIVCHIAIPWIFNFDPSTVLYFQRFTLGIICIVVYATVKACLSSVIEIYSAFEVSKSRPIRAYIQASQIILGLITAIFIVSILVNKSPWGLLSVLGGLTAVLMLVFKDTILGFVASIQLIANGMIAIGDWIEMPKYGADGDIIDISITTVKVRNWDKTISTIPTYALISDAFKNWRGMTESGGRRIKRSIYIDMSSVHFLSSDELDELAGIKCLSAYIAERKAEIEKFNKELSVDSTDMINGRSMTNLGVFRRYISEYLKRNPKIRQDMTFLVRHLQPTSEGLPMEIYVFSNDLRWSYYEEIQADIIDHLLAVMPHFNLQVFQKPSGSDLRHLKQ